MAFSRKKRKRSYKRTTRKRVRKASKAVKRYVRRAVRTFAERMKAKPTLFTGEELVSVQPGIIVDTPPSFIDLSDAWALPNNVAVQGSRQGNKVRVANSMLRVIFFNDMAQVDPAAEVPEYQDMVYKVFIGKLRDRGTNPDITSYNQFLDYGPDITALDNSLQQIYQPVNKEKWVIYKSFILKLDNIKEPFAAIGKNGYGKYFQLSINLGKYMPKTLIYNDDIGTKPINCDMFLWILAATPGGSVPDTGGRLLMSGTQSFEYYDS